MVISMISTHSWSLHINNCSNNFENSAIYLFIRYAGAKQSYGHFTNAHFSLRLHNLNAGRKQCNMY